MSILQYFPSAHKSGEEERLASDDRLKRNPRDDLKIGLDLIFSIKDKLDKLHPLATEALLRIMTY
jgi:hypothetical protein